MKRLFGEGKVAPIGGTQPRQLVQVLASSSNRSSSSGDFLTQLAADARYAGLGHTHAISQVTGLQAALDGKQAASQNLSDWDTLIQVVGGGRGGYVHRVDGEWYVTPNVPTTDLTGTLQASQFPVLTGDVTTVAGFLATTLASVITAAGPVGSAATVPVITYDAKGRLTAVSTASITPAAIGAATAASLANYLPLAAGSGNSLSGKLHGIDAQFSQYIYSSLNSTTVANFVGNTPAPAYWGVAGSPNTADLIRFVKCSATGTISGLNNIAAQSAAFAGDLSFAGGAFNPWVGNNGFTALYPSGVSPTSLNPVLAWANAGGATYLSGTTTVNLCYQSNPKLTVSNAGVSISTQTTGGGILKVASGVQIVDIATPADFPTLNQSTTGNAATATKWATPRTITIGATGQNWDGSANIAFSLAAIGALGATSQAVDSAKLGGQLPAYYAQASSLSGYLPLGGGTLSGDLHMAADIYLNAGHYLMTPGWYTQDLGIYASSNFTFAGADFVFDGSSSKFNHSVEFGSIVANTDYQRNTSAAYLGVVTVATLATVISLEPNAPYNPTSLSSIPNGTKDGQRVTIANNGPSACTCSFGIRSTSIPSGGARTWTWNAAHSVWI